MLDHFVDMYVAVTRLPDPPKTLQSTVKGSKVSLEWSEPEQCRETQGYNVYTSMSRKGPFDLQTDKPVAGLTWSGKHDDRAKFYVVTAVEYSGLEGYGSPVVAARNKQTLLEDRLPAVPLLVDTIAPDAPEKLQSKNISENVIWLKWKASASVDVDHYNVYCSTTSLSKCDQSHLIGSPSENEFMDWGLQVNQEYHYYVSAVDRHGNESEAIYAVADTHTSNEIVTLSVGVKSKEVNVVQSAELFDDPNETLSAIKGESYKWAVDLPTSGLYSIWLKTHSGEDSKAKCSVRVGGKVFTLWTYGKPNQWSWNSAGKSAFSPTPYELPAGKIEIEIVPGASMRMGGLVISNNPVLDLLRGISLYGDAPEK